MWQVLSANDRTLNRIHQQSLLEQFYQEKWNNTTETLRMYLNRLDTYRTQLADTPIAISEQILLSRLLQSLPNEPNWQQAKNFCIQANGNLTASVALLQSYELIIAATTTAPEEAVALVRASRTRGRGRGSRGRWRGGNNHNRDGRDRSRSQGKFEKLAKDQCAFCRKKGHYRDDYRQRP